MQTEQRLKQIIEANKTEITFGGMAGALQVFESMGSAQMFKRKAAEAILSHRACVKSNREFFKREYRGFEWLNRAAYCRTQAMNGN